MHLNHHIFYDIGQRALVLHEHLHNQPRGTKCDFDQVKSQKHKASDKIDLWSFGFDIDILTCESNVGQKSTNVLYFTINWF